MAKKKNEDTKNVGCALIAIALTIGAIFLVIGVQIIPLIAGPIFAICAIVYFFRYMSKDRPFVKNNFALTSTETSLLSETTEKYKWALNKKIELNRIIEDEGLRVNANGRLSQRSYRGQDVQGAMDNANGIISEEKPIYDYLVALPEDRYKKASKHFSRYWGFFLSFSLWAIVLSTQPRTEMLNHHSYQTSEAVSSIMDIWTSDNNEGNEATSSNTKIEKKKDSKNKESHRSAPPKPNITVWDAFFILCFAYLVVFIIAKIYFSLKHKKPEK